jgi:hypothetical protein
MDNRKIAAEIELDILNGVYDNFEKLKSRLLYIVGKLKQSYMVINSSKELSTSEVKTLEENGYL